MTQSYLGQPRAPKNLITYVEFDLFSMFYRDCHRDLSNNYVLVDLCYQNGRRIVHRRSGMVPRGPQTLLEHFRVKTSAVQNNIKKIQIIMRRRWTIQPIHLKNSKNQQTTISSVDLDAPDSSTSLSLNPFVPKKRHRHFMQDYV